MDDWKNWEVGDIIQFSWKEFDGSGTITGILTKKGKNHSIVDADGMHLWLDDENKKMFRFVRRG